MSVIDKVNLQQTLDRSQAFVERRLGSGILAEVSYPTESDVKTRTPASARVRECLALEQPEQCVAVARTAATRLRLSLADQIPYAYPTRDFGESVWAGFFGSAITFAGTDDWTWSYCSDPPIKDLAAFDFPGVSMDNRWLKGMLQVTEGFVGHMEPVCAVTPFIFMDALNLLVELRGAVDAMRDLYDHPEMMERFMEWSIDVNIPVYDAQATLVKGFVDAAFGGHPFRQYASDCMPNLSVDAYGLCKAEVYRRWGLESHCRLVSHYAGGRLHIHGNGRHLCELVAQNCGLTSCDMGDDPGFSPACDIVEELKQRMSPIPISVSIPKDQFLARLQERTLPGGVLYKLCADRLDEANAIMQKVFAYSASRCAPPCCVKR